MKNRMFFILLTLAFCLSVQASEYDSHSVDVEVQMDFDLIKQSPVFVEFVVWPLVRPSYASMDNTVPSLFCRDVMVSHTVDPAQYES